MYDEACFVWLHLKDKFFVSPNPINLPLMQQKSLEKFVLPPNVYEKDFFLSIARLTRQKNVYLLLNGYKYAKDPDCL